MPCLNPDGTLTRFAHAVLAHLATGPADAPAIAAAHALPLYRVRATMREAASAGLIESLSGSISAPNDQMWRLTPLGHEALELGAPDGLQVPDRDPV